MSVVDAARMDEMRVKSAAVRADAARQRKALVGAPVRVQVPALVEPTPEIGRYKIGTLFAPTGGGPSRGVFPGVGPYTLNRVLRDLAEEGGLGRRNWHREMRLGDLTTRERRRLVKRLLAAPRLGPPRRSQVAA